MGLLIDSCLALTVFFYCDALIRCVVTIVSQDREENRVGGFVQQQQQQQGEQVAAPGFGYAYGFDGAAAGAAAGQVGPMNVTDVSTFLNNGLSTER